MRLFTQRERRTGLLAALEDLQLGHVLLEALHVDSQGLLRLVDASVIHGDANLSCILLSDLGLLYTHKN